jgi:hypothetical protein
MTPVRLLVFCCCALLARMAAADILLGGEPLHRDANGLVRFTDAQLRNTAAATRDGLVLWAATAHGRRLLDRFSRGEYKVVVIEDVDEEGQGRAPQPGIFTLAAAGDPTKIKVYELILNPTSRDVPGRGTPALGGPVTTADKMAATWAGEMLHLDFYARGITLPHHQRTDFQETWREMAAELGFPGMTHGSGALASSPALPYNNPFNRSYPARLTGIRVPSFSSAMRLSFA